MLTPDFQDRIQGRLLFLRYPLWLAVIILLLRFWNLQVVRGGEFAAIAEDNHLHTERRRAPRGLILDRHGEVLADNEPSFALLADTEGLRQLERIGQLPALDPAELRTLRLRAERGPTAVRSDLTFSEVAWFEARRGELDGVRVDFVPARRYPHGAATAHLLGHVGEVTRAQLLLEEFVDAAAGDLVGQSGVERFHNRLLRGSDGYVDWVVDSRQRVLVESGLRRTEPTRGATLRLGVSGAVQAAARKAFAEESGAFAAIHVRTGEVLGLASYPAHDPREFRRDSQVFRSLKADGRSPLLNRAVQGVYPPGSTFKLVTAAAALGEGVASQDTRITCRGRARVAGRTFRCHRAEGHGTLSLRQAIAKSCNVFFYRLTDRLDVDVIAAWAERFGLGERTGLDFPNEVRGLVPTRSWKQRVYGERWYASETASVAVGQGAVQVTPIQMARLVSGVASGWLPSPGLVRGGEPRRISELDAEQLALIRGGMRDAVEGGTAWRARLPRFAVAGKTGTAQVAAASRVARNNADRPRELRTHAWFVGFAPFEAPEIAVAVVVEHGGAGGAAAAPVGRAILEAWQKVRETEGGNPFALAFQP